MKNLTSRLTRGLLMLTAVSMLSWTALGTSLANDHHDAWSHDHDGYWDDHGVHHAYILNQNHHGFWRTRDDGTRIFINID